MSSGNAVCKVSAKYSSVCRYMSGVSSDEGTVLDGTKSGPSLTVSFLFRRISESVDHREFFEMRLMFLNVEPFVCGIKPDVIVVGWGHWID